MALEHDNSNASITEMNSGVFTRRKSQRATTLHHPAAEGRELDSEGHTGRDTESLSPLFQQLQLEDDARSSIKHLLLEIQNELDGAGCDTRNPGAAFWKLQARCRHLEDRADRAEHDLNAQKTSHVKLETRYNDLQINYNELADEAWRDTEAFETSRQKRQKWYNEAKTRANNDIMALKISLREYETKWNQLTEQHETLERQCSALVEEISSLRSKNLIDDESVLLDNFGNLHFSIRSWCIGLRDKKLDSSQPLSLTNPVLDDKFLYSCDAEASEIHFLMAGLWTWLIKLVFHPLTDMECDHPDLWTEQKSSEAMRVLERGLVRQGKIVRGHTGVLGANTLRCQKCAGMAQPDGPSTCTMSFRDGSPVHRTHHREDHELGNN
jgi:hypothetical protein